MARCLPIAWLGHPILPLALKANQEKGKIKILVEEETSSNDDLDDVNIALLVNKITKMLKRLNQEGIKFDSRKKKFFSSSKRKPFSENGLIQLWGTWPSYSSMHQA
jgi:hypothetical protein